MKVNNEAQDIFCGSRILCINIYNQGWEIKGANANMSNYKISEKEIRRNPKVSAALIFNGG